MTKSSDCGRPAGRRQCEKHAAVMMLALLALTGNAVFAKAFPVSKTVGERTELPYIDTNRYEISGPVEARAIPLKGWNVGWTVKIGNEAEQQTGIKIIETNDVVRGAVRDVLRIELTHGELKNNWRLPVVKLDQPFNAADFNVLSFVAKLEVPATLKRRINDGQGVPAWFNWKWNSFFDDFGVSGEDGRYPWSGSGVPTTYFKRHDLPETRTEDGYTDFMWDMVNEETAQNKSFMMDRAQALSFLYDTRKIPEGEKVVITIAAPKFLKGVQLRPDPDTAEDFKAWKKFVAEYEPDYSDSSKYLLPPETGRIAKPIRIAENGKAKCEIIADYSDAILVDKFFPRNGKWSLFLREYRGKEKEAMRYAADELSRWLGVVTGGAEVPVLLEPSTNKNVKIFLGGTYAKGKFDADLRTLAGDGTTSYDGYGIRVRDGNIYIFSPTPSGVLFGVYDFVENNTDIIWAFNGDLEDGTVFTESPTLDIVWADTVSKPAFTWRALWLEQMGLRNGFNMNHEYGWWVNGGHYLSPQYYTSSEGMTRFNPVLDRYAGDGKTREKDWTEGRTLCCLANPEFLKNSTQYLPNVKTYKYKGREMCIFGVDDNFGACECEYCTAPIKLKDGTIMTPEKDYLRYYNAWFYTYLNKLDGEIQKYAPGFTTSTFAYFFALPFPEVEISKNIQPQFCFYVKKSQANPLCAPVNKQWWKWYSQWAKHAPDMQMYDYWGLGWIMYPKAEAFKFDAKALCRIGSRVSYAEGRGSCEHLMVGNDRWCIGQLLWNPDLDLEQLHRYFNRRTYREAAPWMDRFFGTIRKSVLQQGHFHMDFEDGEENSLVGDLIRGLGIEDELRGYLNKALAEVKHPTARVNIERTLADFNFYMQTGKANSWSFPGDDGNWFRAHPRKEAAAWTKIRSAGKPLVEAEWVAKEQALNAAADSGKEDATYKQMAIVARDGRLGQEKVVGALRGALIRLVRAKKGAMDVEKVCELVRKHDGDIRGKALGYSLAAAQPWGKSAWGWFIDELAKAYSDFGCWTEVSRLYDYWAHCDGEKTPEEYVSERYGRGLSMLRSRKDQTERAAKQTADRAKAEPASTPAQEAAATAAARLQRLNAQIARDRDRFMKAAAVTVKAGSDHRVRYRAERSLFDENRDRMSSDARKAQIEAWVKNDMLFDDDRKAAASLIIAEYINNQSTNCTALAEHAHKLLAIGDWRNNFYINHRNWRNDYKRDFMIGVSDAIVKAGAKDVAKTFIERAAKDLGYTAAYDKPDANGKEAPGWKKEVAKWVDDAMKRCGAVRQ